MITIGIEFWNTVLTKKYNQTYHLLIKQTFTLIDNAFQIHLKNPIWFFHVAN